MRRLHLWLSICGVLLFLAGGALGFVAARQSGPVRTGLQLPEYSAPWLLRSQEIWEALDLDADQKGRIRDLLAEHYGRNRELRGQLEALATETHATLREVLSDSQRERLEEIRTRYSVTHIESEAIREIVLMRREVGLAWEQEPDVYQVLYDYLWETRKYFKSCRDEGDRPDRSRLEEMSARRFARLGEILDEEQLALYRKVVEERRKWSRRRHHRGDKKNNGETKDGE